MKPHIYSTSVSLLLLCLLFNGWNIFATGNEAGNDWVLLSGWAEMPAVLIEGGVLSDSVEQKEIADPKYRAHLAAAIVQGVLAYQRAVKS